MICNQAQNITGSVNGQVLTIAQPVIAADSVDYLTARFSFSEDWTGAEKFAFFAKSGHEDDPAEILLIDDEITADAHLNLPAGRWNVWLVGLRTEGAEVTQRITTTVAEIRVQLSGVRNAEPFPGEAGSAGEQIVAQAIAARNAAQTAAQNAGASANSAAEAAVSAAMSEDSAQESAENAENSARTAQTTAGTATAAASSASASASAAAGSAVAAAQSEQTAKASAQTATAAAETATAAAETATAAAEDAIAAKDAAIDAKEYVDLVVAGLFNARHYTARWNKTNAEMTRLNDAAHITTTVTNFCHRGSVNPNYNNPFDKIYPWSGRKLCNIDIDAYRALTAGQSITRAVKAWEGDTDFSYTDVNGVWVYTPEFWGKSWDETVGSTEYRYFDVADKPCGGYVHYQERIEGRWHGRIQTVSIDGTDKTCLIPSVGMPAKSIAISTLHTYAKNWGATLDSIFSIDANDLLMIVEFATMNSRSAIGSGVDSMNRQSSDRISAASTDSTVVKVSKSAGSAYCLPGAIFDIGTSNGGTQVGSFLVVSAVTDPEDSTLLDVTLNAAVTVTTSNYWSVHGMGNAADADIGSQSGYIGTNGKSIAYYRGEELFGNLWFYILGAYRQTGTHHVFIAHDDNEADAADALNASLHIDTGIALAATLGYVKKLGTLSRSGLLCCPPFCAEIGGDSANPVGDYHSITPSAGNTVLVRGGYANYDARNGAFYGMWNNTASISSWNFAARPRLKNP